MQKWLNKGGRFITASGEEIQPGGTFFADDVPDAFKDVLVPIKGGFRRALPEGAVLDATENTVAEKTKLAPGLVADPAFDSPPLKSATEFEIRSSSAGWFKIVNASTGKPIDSKSYREADAKIKLKELTDGVEGDE